MKPNDANLRGELTLDQLGALQELTWPGLAEDLNARWVREIPEAEVVPIDEALGWNGAAYGVRIKSDAAPVAPSLRAMAGRYRAWVLPSTGIAIALDALEDEDAYVQGHRRELLHLQSVTEDDLVPLDAKPTHVDGVVTHKDLRSGDVTIGGKKAGANGLLLRRIVVGVRYRLRATKRGVRVFEAVAFSAMGAVGPYR